MESVAVETYRGVAHSWLCDAMGHLNTRHYLAMFDDALHHYMLLCGFDAQQDHGLGLADVNVTLELRAEVRPGSLVTIKSSTKRIGRTSLVSTHTMLDAASQEICAVCEIITVQLDLSARRAVPLLPELREGAATFFPRTEPDDDGAGHKMEAV